jgi:hypothetical protein
MAPDARDLSLRSIPREWQLSTVSAPKPSFRLRPRLCENVRHLRGHRRRFFRSGPANPKAASILIQRRCCRSMIYGSPPDARFHTASTQLGHCGLRQPTTGVGRKLPVRFGAREPLKRTLSFGPLSTPSLTFETSAWWGAMAVVLGQAPPPQPPGATLTLNRLEDQPFGSPRYTAQFRPR